MITDETYYKLAKVLDTLPNGFPATENGIKIKLLKSEEARFYSCIDFAEGCLTILTSKA
ncbi:MAG: hypothetical protein OET81_06880 [Desulfobacteraceae bacterium]|nr:hypothetical protein [Desulfobacteraceae bacterium]MDH3574930.1 hypothetical protein [Desulfobacteraceae bacterium]MDH3838079.1 hypothetical protein [Desulfobacteraceae bacterium]MDH3874256.1 hypothetical protein [Desulfobacteraceae bacterium]MDH3882281.1 hypothetical protein [Desulfobacteraceae bacterium]